jgi:membrane fusion protein (multidrug efflux system)
MRYFVLVLAVVACGRDRAPSSPRIGTLETASLAAVPPTVTTADTATVEVPLALPSQLYVEHDATVYARSGGIVQSILVDLGSRVTAGQLLAKLEDTDQEIALAQAREKFTNTRQMVERQRELKVAGVVTQADSERVEFEHREAVLALRQAQRDFDLTRIVAPFSGVVTSRAARLHRLVNSGDSLFRITALRPILAAVRVPESSAANIEIGTVAEVIGPGGVEAQAKVIRASPVLDAGSGTREMVLQLSEKARLTPGSNVTVRLGSEPRQVVAIPRTAVAEDGYALVWANEKTTLRRVTTGSEIGDDRIEVISGLVPGEKILRTVP